MGKKNKGTTSLGRSLIKDRFSNSNHRKRVDGNSMLHTTEIQDGYDWGRLNLQSVTEESSFQEFLSTAELAGTEFQAEKLNIKFVNPKSSAGLLTKDERRKVTEGINRNKASLKIPRRPPWTKETTPEELEQNEREQFLEWRRTLSRLQEEEGMLLTPYEKNLEFWRQLWRVIERSDVIVQIVDARNPLLFRCEDLETYVKEVSEDKLNLILVNKADYLTEQQRQCWAKYFSSINVRVAFFSAVYASMEKEQIDGSEVPEEEEANLEQIKASVEKLDLAVENVAEQLSKITANISGMLEEYKVCPPECLNSAKLLSRDELINLFRTLQTGKKVNEGSTTIGLVGYPNVGKSSTINALLTYKKVSVSAMPGKTKHFQTLYLDKDLILCDCPGLVMPSFVYTKAEMIINGILPIDQMRDQVPPVNLVCNLIPKHILEDTYGIMIPPPLEGEDPNRSPLAEELLNAYGYNRGYMTANGQPDNPRSARYILKDFVNGKLLYAHAPPSIKQDEYHEWPEVKKAVNREFTPREARAIKPNKTTTEDLDKAFFKIRGDGAHAKGFIGKSAGCPASKETGSQVEKPWKALNKHKNKNRKEKLRRVYAHLDQH